MSRLLMDEFAVLVALVVLRVTVLLAVAWLLHGALRGRNPWWQISLWRTVTLAVVAIAAAGPFLPGWGPNLNLSVAGPIAVRPAPLDAPRPQPVESPDPSADDAPEWSEADPDQQTASQPAPMPVPPTAPETMAQPAAASPRAISFSIPGAVVGCYVIVAGLLVARFLLQFLRLRSIISKAEPANERVAALAAATARELGISKPPLVVVSSCTSGPLAAGILRPVIVLSTGFAEQLSDPQLRLVMVHECSHFAGRDLAWALAARFLRIVLWPHPLSWGIPAAHRFACDVRCDAIAAGRDAGGYAQMLARLALSLQPQPAAPMALAFLEKSETVRRIKLIDAGVGANRPARLRWWPAALGMTAVLGLVATLGVYAVQTGVVLGQAEQEDLAKINVTILDPDENPVAGAEVSIEYIDTGRALESLGLEVSHATTNAAGVAVVSFPARFKNAPEDRGRRHRIRFDIRHAEFVRANPHIGIDGPFQFILQPGRRVRLSARDAATGRRITDKLFVLFQSNYLPEEVRWPRSDDGVFSSPALDTDVKNLLVVALRDGDVPLFSDQIDLGAYPGRDVRIDDVPLSPGAHVKGRLSDKVPRPVQNGRVQLRVDYATDEQSKYAYWEDTANVTQDGTFEFPSVPRNGWMQLVADCEGWVSASTSTWPDAGSGERQRSIEKWGDGSYCMIAQQFPPQAGLPTAAPLEVKMEPAAACEVTLTDTNGGPLANVTVSVSVGSYFYVNTTCFGTPRRTAEGLQFNPADLEQLLEQAAAQGAQVTLDFNNRFQAVTDANGVATIRNLPALMLHVELLDDTFQIPREEGAVALKSGETIRTSLTGRHTNSQSGGQELPGETPSAARDELLGGNVERDERLPGHPIVGLDLADSKVTDAELEELKGLTHLKTLNLAGTHITDAGLAHLTGMISLEGLELKGTPITDAGLEHLKGLMNLRSLDLDRGYYRNPSWPQISDAGLEHLKGLTNLVSLHLAGTGVTGAGLAHLRGLTHLEQLLLHGSEISDEGLEHLGELTSLKRLSLSRTQVTDAGLVHLKGLVNLELLILINESIGDAGLEHLKELSHLEALQLNTTNVTNAGMEHLTHLPSLNRVHLDETNVGDAGLERLKNVTGLTSLGLGETQVTDAGLVHLAGLQKLATLELRHTKITNAGLQHLAALKSLTTLDLSDTAVTDAGLAQLTGLTNLRRLNVNRTRVTKEGRGTIRKSLPKCEFVGGP